MKAKLELDKLDQWYKFKIVKENGQSVIDLDSSIPASVKLEWKEFHIKWWDRRKERIAKRMARMLCEK